MKRNVFKLFLFINSNTENLILSQDLKIQAQPDLIRRALATDLQVREDFAVVGRNQSGRVPRIILNHILYYQYLMHSLTSRGHSRTIEH